MIAKSKTTLKVLSLFAYLKLSCKERTKPVERDCSTAHVPALESFSIHLEFETLSYCQMLSNIYGKKYMYRLTVD